MSGMAPTTSVGIGSRHDDGADYDGFHDNDEGEEDDNDENWVYLYNANLSWKRRQQWKKLLGSG